MNWFWKRRQQIPKGARVKGRLQYEEPVKFETARLFGDCSLGAFTYLNFNVRVNDATIGRYCSIGEGAHIGAIQHPMDRLSTHPFAIGGNKFTDDDIYNGIAEKLDRHHRRTVIGNDVWVGTRAIIMPGVSVGDGAVIGAGAVVTKDVPPYSIAVGVPAVVKRLRFDQPTVDRLLASQWWNFRPDLLRERPSYADVNGVLDALEAQRPPKLAPDLVLVVGKPMRRNAT